MISHAKTLVGSPVNFVVLTVMLRSEHDIMVGQGSKSESENGMWHHAQTSWRKNAFYIFFERMIINTRQEWIHS